jgi:hypothetical protein
MTSPMSRLALPVLSLVLLLAPADVDAQYRYLCASAPSACTYTGPNAPMLNATVCYGSAIGVRLKGSAPCPSGSWPYYLDFGEVVNPLTNQVAAYIPLNDACDQPGLCVKGPPPAGSQEYPMCCVTTNGEEICYQGSACGGTLWWCNDGVCNGDGTITCFEQEPD